MKLLLICRNRRCSKPCSVDAGLNEERRRQASLLEEHLSHENVQTVCSNSLLRAMETAQAVNLYWNVEYIIRPELREVSFSHIEGMDNRDIVVKYRDFKAQQALIGEDLPYLGGKCVEDVVRRAQPVFREMTEGGHERVAVVTHGGVIRPMIVHYLGIPMNKWRVLGKNLKNCNITELNWDGASGYSTLGHSNDYAHLEPHPGLLQKRQVSVENQGCTRTPAWLQG